MLARTFPRPSTWSADGCSGAFAGIGIDRPIRFLLPLLLLLLALGLSACGGDDEPERRRLGRDDDTAGGEVREAVDSQTIAVTSPAAGDTLARDKFKITGTARSLDGRVHYRLLYDSVLALAAGGTLKVVRGAGDSAAKEKNPTRRVPMSRPSELERPSKASPYTITVEYTSDWTGPALLEVFEIDPYTRQEVGLVTIPVFVRQSLPSKVAASDTAKPEKPGKAEKPKKPAKSSDTGTPGDTGKRVRPPAPVDTIIGGMIYAYFPNSKMGSLSDCKIVYPLSRPLPTGSNAAARAAIYALIKGVTAAEAEEGYHSRLPKGLRLEGFSMEDGVARLDFSDHINRMKRTCPREAVRAQIEQTLAQFRSINAVVITIKGVTWTGGR